MSRRIPKIPEVLTETSGASWEDQMTRSVTRGNAQYIAEHKRQDPDLVLSLEDKLFLAQCNAENAKELADFMRRKKPSKSKG